MALEQDTVRLAKGKNLATVVTLMRTAAQALPPGSTLTASTCSSTPSRPGSARRTWPGTADHRAHPGSDDPWTGPRSVGTWWILWGPGSAPAHRRALPQVRGYEYSAPIGPGAGSFSRSFRRRPTPPRAGGSAGQSRTPPDASGRPKAPRPSPAAG